MATPRRPHTAWTALLLQISAIFTASSDNTHMGKHVTVSSVVSLDCFLKELSTSTFNISSAALPGRPQPDFLAALESPLPSSASRPYHSPFPSPWFSNQRPPETVEIVLKRHDASPKSGTMVSKQDFSTEQKTSFLHFFFSFFFSFSSLSALQLT